MNCRGFMFAPVLTICLLLTPNLSFAEEKLMWYRNKEGKEVKVPSRLIPEQDGTSIRIFYNACLVALTFSEKPRKTRIEQDLAALFSKLKSSALNDGCDDKASTEYTPQLVVSTVTVAAVSPAGKTLSSQEIAWGPVEHLSLSVDLPVSNRKTLKYDEASHSLKPKDDKAQVYLGLNYSLGDVIRAETFRDRTDVKFMILASKRPLDSFGIGIGHKLTVLKPLGIEINGLSIFAGYFSTRQDKIDAGVPQENDARTRQWRVGLSYDLSTGASWLKF